MRRVSCVKRIARDTTRLVLTSKPLHASTFNDFQLLQMPRVSLHNFASLFSRERAEPRAPWVPPPRGRLRRPAAARLCWPVVGVCLCWPGECPQPQHSRVSPARSVVRHSGPGGRAGALLAAAAQSPGDLCLSWSPGGVSRCVTQCHAPGH